MTAFEQTWHDKYMNNLCTEATLNKLAQAQKLNTKDVQNWVKERMETYGY